MGRGKPPLVPLGELTPWQSADFFALLAERSRGTTRDGKPFFTCRFRDARRTATYMVWVDGPWYDACAADWREGRFYKVRATYGEHERYGAQIDVHNIRVVTDDDRAEGFDPAAFVERSRHDPEAMFAQLRQLAAESIADAPLRRLVLTLLDRHAEALKRLPATPRHFYPFAGGLLEHTLSVTQSCLHLAEKYARQYPDLRPPLNRDLVAAAAVLHDIGRVVELDAEAAAPQPTVPGRLLGHLLLGRDLMRDAAREQGDIHPELVRLLEHILVSHLALPEWGSPRLPLVPECLIIHHADDLDAKLEMYARCLTRDREEGPFTARDPMLGKRLYKGREV